VAGPEVGYVTTPIAVVECALSLLDERVRRSPAARSPIARVKLTHYEALCASVLVYVPMSLFVCMGGWVGACVCPCVSLCMYVWVCGQRHRRSCRCGAC
jgi:hypothetical protein